MGREAGRRKRELSRASEMELRDFKVSELFFALAIAAVVIAVAAYLLFFRNSPIEVRVADAVSLENIDGAAVKVASGNSAFASVSQGGVARFAGIPNSGPLTVEVAKYGYENFSQTLAFPSRGLFSVLLHPVPTPAANSSAKADFLIVSNREALAGKYGTENGRAIEGKLANLAKAARDNDGLSSRVEFISARDGKSALSQINFLLAESRARYLLIVGGDSIVPFQQVANPLLAKQDVAVFAFIAKQDSEVPSDYPYARGGKVAVGRIHDGSDSKAGSSPAILPMLDYAIKAHAAQIPETSLEKIISADNYGPYLDEMFSTQKSPRKAAVSPPLFYYALSPPSTDGDAGKVIALIGTGRIAYLSLHGNDPGESQLFAGRENDANYAVITAALAKKGAVENKFFLADSCYGATPMRTAEESIPVALLSRGALGFIGSTTSSFSNSDALRTASDSQAGSLGVSNALLYYAARGISEGKRQGDALNAARVRLDAADALDRLTIVQFILNGDPTLRAG